MPGKGIGRAIPEQIAKLAHKLMLASIWTASKRRQSKETPCEPLYTELPTGIVASSKMLTACRNRASSNQAASPFATAPMWDAVATVLSRSVVRLLRSTTSTMLPSVCGNPHSALHRTLDSFHRKRLRGCADFQGMCCQRGGLPASVTCTHPLQGLRRVHITSGPPTAPPARSRSWTLLPASSPAPSGTG